MRRTAGKAAVPTWFRMFLTGEVTSEKTKRQRLSCKEKYELNGRSESRCSDIVHRSYVKSRD